MRNEEQTQTKYLVVEFMNKTYCSNAFDHIYSNASGKYKLCCLSRQHPSLEKFNTNSHKPFEFYLSDEMETIRNDMLAGKSIKGCEICYDAEKAGFKSPRQTERIYYDVGKIDIRLRIFGSACNLTCFMCHPVNSSSRNKEMSTIDTDIFELFDPKFYVVDREAFNAATDDILEHLDLIEFITIIGGEPFVMTPHYEFLDKIPFDKRKEITLLYQTNLTTLNHMRWDFRDYIDTFKKVILRVSSDHYGERLAWIRYPIDVAQFESNLTEFRDYIDHKDGGIEITASLLNIRDIEEIIDYYKSKFGLQAKIGSVVRDPPELSIKNLDNKFEICEMLDRINAPEFVYHELMKPKSDEEYQRGIDYIKKLDEKRGTKCFFLDA